MFCFVFEKDFQKMVFNDFGFIISYPKKKKKEKKFSSTPGFQSIIHSFIHSSLRNERLNTIGGATETFSNCFLVFLVTRLPSPPPTFSHFRFLRKFTSFRKYSFGWYPVCCLAHCSFSGIRGTFVVDHVGVSFPVTFLKWKIYVKWFVAWREKS